MWARLKTQDGALVSIVSAPKSAVPASPVVLAEVYRLHVGDVGRWAARLGGPRVDVDDVVQEVFIIVNRQLATFRGDAKLTTWLFRITERVVKNHRRWWAVRRIVTRLTARHAEVLAATDADPLQELERRVAVESAYRVLDQLPEKYRRVLILCELEGLEAEQIASLLEAPVATVRVWLHRARRMFLDRLDDDPDAPAHEEHEEKEKERQET
jgi:RNA polymerase sigma-70 factor (ECF subfamily)